MAATYTPIREAEMRQFLDARGFREIDLENTKELVFGRRMDKNGMPLSLRVYSSIKDGVSRDSGEDAIRVCVFWMDPRDGEIRLVGSQKRVHRIQTWRKNLMKRIRNADNLMGPCCSSCDAPTVKRSGGYGEFWGCSRYPNCKNTRSCYEND